MSIRSLEVWWNSLLEDDLVLMASLGWQPFMLLKNWCKFFQQFMYGLNRLSL
jgi:hypothetical protein